MIPEQLEATQKASEGFPGEFHFVPEHTEDQGVGNCADYVDVDDALVYVQSDDEDPHTIASPIESYVAEPLATMLNAVPELLAELTDLRAQLDHAISENLAFNVKVAREINEARSQRDALGAALIEACDLAKSIAWKLHRECPNDLDETEHPKTIERFNELRALAGKAGL